MPSDRSMTTVAVEICSQKPARVPKRKLRHRVGSGGQRRDVGGVPGVVGHPPLDGLDLVVGVGVGGGGARMPAVMERARAATRG